MKLIRIYAPDLPDDRLVGTGLEHPDGAVLCRWTLGDSTENTSHRTLDHLLGKYPHWRIEAREVPDGEG